MNKGILTEKACNIIREEAKLSLQELASREPNMARTKNIKYLYLERARGAVRPSAGLALTPADIEQEREEISHFRLPLKKTAGFRRILRLFR